jgi:hypothetical protein
MNKERWQAFNDNPPWWYYVLFAALLLCAAMAGAATYNCWFGEVIR